MKKYDPPQVVFPKPSNVPINIDVKIILFNFIFLFCIFKNK